MKKSGRAGDSHSRGRSIPVAVLLIFVVLLSAGSGLYAGASYFAQQAPNVTTTTTIFTTVTSWITSTIWSTATEVTQGVLTTIEYTTSTSTVTVTGGPDTSTRLLLHMDGADGSQTFVDSSLEAHSITANGNAQIDTAQSKFGGASGLFDGSGDYLSTADSSDWAFGSGDFTIDFWVRFNALPSSGGYVMLTAQYVSVSSYWQFYLYNSAGTYKWYITANTGVSVTKDSPGLLTNTWYHVAVVRSGNSWYIFQNGTQCGTTGSNSNAMPDVAAVLTVGARSDGSSLNGWLDEVRISKGVARWTANFTPPTAPY